MISEVSMVSFGFRLSICSTVQPAQLFSIFRTAKNGALETNRTSGQRFRKPLLYPLSYEGTLLYSGLLQGHILKESAGFVKEELKVWSGYFGLGFLFYSCIICLLLYTFCQVFKYQIFEGKLIWRNHL